MTKKSLLSEGYIHFIGIGGIGMSGIAEVMFNRGYKVRGSDIVLNSNSERLRSLGIEVTIGHSSSNIEGASAIVYSSAIGSDNEELKEARRRMIPVVRRAEMLSELMKFSDSVAVGGSHGKTTTTSLIASVFELAGLDPTVINGGIVNAWGSNTRLGDGEWVIAEADESDGSFLRLSSTITVVTNIDCEHLDHYGDFSSLRETFIRFASNIPFYGFTVLCFDDSEAQELLPELTDRRVLTYGFSSQAMIRASHVVYGDNYSSFIPEFTFMPPQFPEHLPRITLPMIGEHNVLNALAAIGVSANVGIDFSHIRQGLESFTGVKRRFTKIGETTNGLIIIDDYAHHPTEILMTLKATRCSYPEYRIIAVFQPHRYSRVSNLFDEFCRCFNLADTVIVCDIYGAGEASIEGIDRHRLVLGLRQRGHRDVRSLDSFSDLSSMLCGISYSPSVVLCLGAGDITEHAAVMLSRINELHAGKGS